MRKIRILRSALLFLSVASCQQMELAEEPQSEDRRVLSFQGVIDQEYVTRANDNGFATGDKMGVYIVDYNGDVPGSLEESGIRASNMQYIYDADKNTWSNPVTLYWRDSVTPVDVYGYYPGVDHIENPLDYQIEVSYRQDVVPADGSMSAYEASDFMWAKAAKVAPTSDVIVLNYTHRMAGVKVSLVKGTGISDSEWSAAQKTVQIDNVIRRASIDITDGVPVPVGEVDKSILASPQSGDVFRAVVVPQTVPSGNVLLSVTIDGRTYGHSLTSDMVYAMGKLHNFTFTVNKKEATGDYQLHMSYEGIADWTNDELSHDFTSNSYITINVPQAEGLEQAIAEKGIDPTDIENLKITGNLNEKDFEFIRKRMSGSLRRINLEGVKLAHIWSCDYWDFDKKTYVNNYLDDYLPDNALRDMTYLRQVILPANLKHVGSGAFSHLELTSPLIIPEGVTHLHGFSCECNADIVLPHSLEYIGGCAFYGEAPRAELVMTDRLRYIGGSAFWRARGITGTFYLSPNLEYLGDHAFESCGTNLSGDIVIPSSITEIPGAAFQGMGFANGTNLIMHDAITKIDDSAFAGTRIKNAVEWPKNLVFIEKNAFSGCSMILNDFVFPENLRKLASGAFWNNHIGGTLVIPDTFSVIEGAFNMTDIRELIVGDGVVYLSRESFASCSYLERVTLGKNVDYIGERCFNACSALSTFICLAEEPPKVWPDSFNGIYFDKCILQVPEKSVDKYRATDVWNQFQNITAYKELAFNVPDILTLDKGASREGIIRAEGPWEVIECPSWVSVSPSSGQGKAEVTVTVDAQAPGSSSREGRIVFSLTGKNYTTYTDVRQVGAEVAEDQTVVLQTASAGALRPIPLFIVGEGYDADDIVSGKYLQDMTQQMEHFFSIEPMKTYRDYFTVSTAYAVSPESGLGGLTRFDSEYYGNLHGNDDMVRDYARRYGAGIDGNESNATILVLMNTDVTANSTSLYDFGLAISWMGKSGDVYPYDQRGHILHESVGTAFGKLGPETITHLTFLDACGCPGCNVMGEYERAQRNGWWKNVSRTNKLKSLPWYHLMFHEKYASLVDIYEGACNHSRGAYRSEVQSVMGNAYVHYFNTISRETLVRRIMQCAGEDFVFEDFVTKDVIELPEQ